MKWEELKKFAACMLDEIRTDGAPNAAFREAVVTVMVEIHGDLDQVGLAIREHNKQAAQILEHWKRSDARAKRSEERAEESHALSMKLFAMSIAREERAYEADIENKKRWEDIQRDFPLKTGGDGAE